MGDLYVIHERQGDEYVPISEPIPFEQACYLAGHCFESRVLKAIREQDGER